MAKSIDITYFSDATATCTNCGSIYTLGMTRESIQLEICANCHPFYSGQEMFIDSAGRIEKFQARAQKANSQSSKSSKQKKVRKFRQNLIDLSADSNSANSEAELVVEVKGFNAPVTEANLENEQSDTNDEE